MLAKAKSKDQERREQILVVLPKACNVDVAAEHPEVSRGHSTWKGDVPERAGVQTEEKGRTMGARKVRGRFIVACIKRGHSRKTLVGLSAAVWRWSRLIVGQV